jgi:hypothetical protein
MATIAVRESNAERVLRRHPPAREARGGASFGCGPGYEELAEELAGLVDGTWGLTSGVRTVIIMANGATVPRKLPGQPSQEAQAWWHAAVTTRLAPTPR